MSELEKLIEASGRGDLAEVQTIARSHPGIINQRDSTGATPLHYAAFGGHRSVVEELVRHGGDLNATDSRHGATPAGWAIEYIREMGGFLEIELNDFAHAIRRGDVEWVKRFLVRFPNLRNGHDTQGKPFLQLAKELGNTEIVSLFSVDSTRLK